MTESLLALDGPLEDNKLWQKTGDGDLSMSQDSNFFVYADGSLKLSFQNAQGDKIEYDKTFQTSRIQGFSFYVRADLSGSYLQFGFGNSSIEENLYTVEVHTANTFLPIRLDISKLNLAKIEKVGFQGQRKYPIHSQCLTR